MLGRESVISLASSGDDPTSSSIAKNAPTFRLPTRSTFSIFTGRISISKLKLPPLHSINIVPAATSPKRKSSKSRSTRKSGPVSGTLVNGREVFNEYTSTCACFAKALVISKNSTFVYVRGVFLKGILGVRFWVLGVLLLNFFESKNEDFFEKVLIVTGSAIRKEAIEWYLSTINFGDAVGSKGNLFSVVVSDKNTNVSVLSSASGLIIFDELLVDNFQVSNKSKQRLVVISNRGNFILRNADIFDSDILVCPESMSGSSPIRLQVSEAALYEQCCYGDSGVGLVVLQAETKTTNLQCTIFSPSLTKIPKRKKSEPLFFSCKVDELYDCTYWLAMHGFCVENVLSLPCSNSALDIGVLHDLLCLDTLSSNGEQCSFLNFPNSDRDKNRLMLQSSLRKVEMPSVVKDFVISG